MAIWHIKQLLCCRSLSVFLFESFSIPFHFSFINYASFQSSCPLIFFLDVWAFDSDAVKALKDMKPMDMEKLVAKYSILLDPDSELLPQNRPNTLVGATCICQFLMTRPTHSFHWSDTFISNMRPFIFFININYQFFLKTFQK